MTEGGKYKWHDRRQVKGSIPCRFGQALVTSCTCFRIHIAFTSGYCNFSKECDRKWIAYSYDVHIFQESLCTFRRYTTDDDLAWGVLAWGSSVNSPLREKNRNFSILEFLYLYLLFSWRGQITRRLIIIWLIRTL